MIRSQSGARPALPILALLILVMIAAACAPATAPTGQTGTPEPAGQTVAPATVPAAAAPAGGAPAAAPAVDPADLPVGVDAEGKPREAQFSIRVPAGLKVTVEVPQARGENEPAKMSIDGADKQKVGQFAAEIRAIRPPEPYKGKGIRYAGEHVRRKQGKAFASGGG